MRITFQRALALRGTRQLELGVTSSTENWAPKTQFLKSKG